MNLLYLVNTLYLTFLIIVSYFIDFLSLKSLKKVLEHSLEEEDEVSKKVSLIKKLALLEDKIKSINNCYFIIFLSNIPLYLILLAKHKTIFIVMSIILGSMNSLITIIIIYDSYLTYRGYESKFLFKNNAKYILLEDEDDSSHEDV